MGLSEIDFEWLIAHPRIIYVGTLTGQPDSLQRVGRIINLAEGKVIDTISKIGYGGKPTQLKGKPNSPKKIKVIKNYNASKHFYTYGFDWKKDQNRWWLIHPTKPDTLVLWNYKGSQLGIPQHKSYYRMNFWYTNNWVVEGNPKSLEKPKLPFELEVDWMNYTEY